MGCTCNKDCSCNCQKPSCTCNGNTGCLKHSITNFGNTCRCNVQAFAIYRNPIAGAVSAACKPQTNQSGTTSNPRTATKFLSQTIGNKITTTLLNNIQTALSKEAQVRSINFSWTAVTAGQEESSEVYARIKNVIDACEAKDKATVYCTCNIYSNTGTNNSGHYSNTTGAGIAIRSTNTPSSEDSISWTFENGASLAQGDKIYTELVNSFQTFTNILQSKCICDCNYCTCNCNYCTCDCNYTTCQCNTQNYCICNYNPCSTQAASCPCQCNYCSCNCNYDCTCNCNYSCKCDCNYSGGCNPQTAC